MSRFLGRRFAFSLTTLFLLSLLVFFVGQVLPGNVGRTILGPLADQEAVDALNRQFGLDRPIVEQYGTWIWHFLQGDMGQSYIYGVPVAPFIVQALGNSLKLALVAFMLVVPLGILGGVLAALNADRPIDRVISMGGLSATVMPEFVSGVVLIMIFGVWLRWLPISAAWPEGAGPLTQLYYVILPAIPLVLVLFGYIARMTRASMIEALDSDYTRTAVLKGLTWRRVIWRHVLRNALLPTITVIASQTGYLIGGLIVVETLFRYQGIGSLIFRAAKAKDFAMLEAGVLIIGITYAVATLLADILYSILNPRIQMETAND
ncbi:MAG: ABC transporter permease subunit [Mesorhizobium sp.]|uniref:ABC transporter permease n=1 Tax=unclassified Mesorhizobium TaxID=325217 RepID=UPI000F75870F|nr:MULTISPECIES: ABC transporter permease [unclassified Mesorhizobium]AZN98015.1 ABC transporter permease [Mesorhizobium sp. M9A.F.Ca.ET.002.03.1.2]AZO19566.1 ABC transporter permease [Mesorhizobium sp. M1E.F.Ca.ET.045.02.1.1]RWB65705.1 MAG: ABC transporter permease subunit [Mesorhizobium sp.]RWJ38147.1 MAG: ABC transporter permease subunit [Mesorhizobium sp.]RWJ78524.1 MAG: ABC transporter permease subunit [Mesorhizobium sp.]